MLGFVAAALFVIAFLINATSTSTSAVFSPLSLLLVGLACLALHLAGIGTGWSVGAGGATGAEGALAADGTEPGRRVADWQRGTGPHRPGREARESSARLRSARRDRQKRGFDLRGHEVGPRSEKFRVCFVWAPAGRLLGFGTVPGSPPTPGRSSPPGSHCGG